MCIVYQDTDILKLFPPRDIKSNKGTFGTLLIVGGSVHYIGAALLAQAGAAALRTGSGIVRLAVPDSLVAPLHGRVIECTLFPLPEKDGYIEFKEDVFLKALSGVTAVVLGVGIGFSEQVFPTVEWLIKNVTAPLLIDADALNILATHTEWLYDRRGATVLTPHIKEAARLTGLDSKDVSKNKISAAKEFAAKFRVNVLLKDYESIITDGEKVIINKRGTPAMAKGGSGDLLSGIIGGLLARKIAPIEAAAAGAYIAGASAELALKHNNEYSLLPSETAQSISEWLTSLITNG